MHNKPYWLYLNRIKPPGLYKTVAEKAREETHENRDTKDNVIDVQFTENVSNEKAPIEENGSDLKDPASALPQEEWSPLEQGITGIPAQSVKTTGETGETGGVVLDLAGFELVTPGVYRFKRLEAISQEAEPPPLVPDKARKSGQTVPARLKPEIDNASLLKIPVYSFG